MQVPRGVLRRSPHYASFARGSRLGASRACCGWARAVRAAGGLVRSPFGESCNGRRVGAMAGGR
eukprot:13307136-Alexandrium_andersonii.AAC.1